MNELAKLQRWRKLLSQLMKVPKAQRNYRLIGTCKQRIAWHQETRKQFDLK